MKLGSKEYYEIVKSFEKSNLCSTNSFAKVTDPEWVIKGYVYENGEVNQMFKAFQSGYAAARCEYLIGA
jgi:hypothetical protein